MEGEHYLQIWWGNVAVGDRDTVNVFKRLLLPARS